MADTDRAAQNSLLHRALALKREASEGRRRADEAGRREIAEFIGDDTGRMEYLRTLADHPRRKPEEILGLTRYRRALGLDRLPRIMSADELDACGWAPKAGARGIDLAAPGPRGGKIRFYAPQEADRTGRGRFDPLRAPDRRIDTSDPAAMDAFVAAADGCDLDSLDPMAEYAVSVSYGLDLPDDPTPPLPPAETDEQLYDALSRIGRQVEAIQAKIDASLKGQRAPRGRDGRRDRTGPSGGPPVGSKKSASLTEAPPERRALTPGSIMAMGAADVVRAVRDRADRLSRKGGGRF